MDMHEKLKQAGFNPPDKPKKIDSKKVNMQMKVMKAEKFLSDIEEYKNRRNSAPDKFIFKAIENSVILSYERFCVAIKDILDAIAVKENISNLSDKRGLGELIRETMFYLNTTHKVEVAAKRLTTRNDTVHDYMNADYYDDVVLSHIENDLSEYKIYLQCIKDYLINKNMINIK